LIRENFLVGQPEKFRLVMRRMLGHLAVLEGAPKRGLAIIDLFPTGGTTVFFLLISYFRLIFPIFNYVSITQFFLHPVVVYDLLSFDTMTQAFILSSSE
jgi:hypothetical protein